MCVATCERTNNNNNNNNNLHYYITSSLCCPAVVPSIVAHYMLWFFKQCNMEIPPGDTGPPGGTL